VRLTQRDIDDNNMESALKRMNSGDAGLAKHDQICPNNIEWHNSKIIGQESNTDKRKFLEAIESIRVISNNKTSLNTYVQMEQWKPFLDKAFKRGKTTRIKPWRTRTKSAETSVTMSNTLQNNSQETQNIESYNDLRKESFRNTIN